MVSWKGVVTEGFDWGTGRYTTPEAAGEMGVPYYQPEGQEQVYAPPQRERPARWGEPGSSIMAGAAIAPAVLGAAAGLFGFDDIPGLPGGEYEFQDILPGGAPFRMPDLPGGLRMSQNWWTGTTMFAIDELGGRWVAKKVRRRFLPDTWTWHKYRLRKPIVIGKQATPKNRRKIVRALKRFNKTARPIYGPSRRRNVRRRR